MSHTQLSVDALQRSCAARPLEQLCLPLSLAPEDLRSFEALIPTWRLEADEFLYRSAERLSALYVVHTGSLELHVEDPGGGRTVKGFYFPGEVLGADALHSGRHCADCIALEPSSVGVVPVYRLEEICALVPNLGRQLEGLMKGDVAPGHQALLCRRELGEEQRLAAVLLALSRRQAGPGCSPTRLKLPMTRCQMATYLGVSAASLGRTLAKLRDAGLLSVEGRTIHLLDIPRLTGISGEDPPAAPVIRPTLRPEAESTGPPRTTPGELICRGLDTAAGCALAAAAVAISAFYWYVDESLDALLLRAFYAAFVASVVCFGTARILELLALAYPRAAKTQFAPTDPAKRGSPGARGPVRTVGQIATERHP